MKKLIALALAASFSVSPLALAPAMADYPEKPVQFVVPWPPGDLEDVLTRLIAEEFQTMYGAPAAVVNRPGGGAVVGATEVANASPDGYTVGSFVAGVPTVKTLGENAPFKRDTFEVVGIFLDLSLPDRIQERCTIQEPLRNSLNIPRQILCASATSATASSQLC